MQSAAATIGEIERPVTGSTGRGFGRADLAFTVLHFGLRHFAKSRSRFEKTSYVTARFDFLEKATAAHATF